MCDRSRRNAGAIAAAAVLAALELLWRANASPAESAIVRADFGITGVAILVTSALGWLGGLFKGRVDANVKRSLEGLRTQIGAIGAAIVDGLAWLGGKLASGLAAVKRFIARVFGPLFEWAKRMVQRLGRVLDRILGPIIDFLDRVKDHLWTIYRDFIKPVLDVIEFLRFPLRLLASFGVDWAKRLDATLANLEDWIVDQFTYALGKVNEAIDAINMIIDVNGLLKRAPFLRSLLRDLYYTSNLWWNSQTRPLTPRQKLNLETPLEGVEPADVIREMQLHIMTGNARISGAIRESVANVRINLRNAA